MTAPIDTNAAAPGNDAGATARPVPGALGLFVVRVVDLALYLVAFGAGMSITLMGDVYGETFFRAEEGAGLLVDAAAVALLVPVLRGQARGPAAAGLRTALGLGVVNVLLGAVQALAVFGGPALLHVGEGAAGLVLYAAFLGLALSFDVVVWRALARIAGGGGAMSAWMTPAYLPLRVLSAVLAFVRLAIPFEMSRGFYFQGPFAIPYRVFTLLLHLTLSALPLVVLYRLHKVGAPGSAYGAATAAPAPSAKESAQRDLVMGSVWLGGGLLVTLVSYAAASSGSGGRYVVTTGAIAYGLVRLVRGMIRLGAG